MLLKMVFDINPCKSVAKFQDLSSNINISTKPLTYIIVNTKNEKYHGEVETIYPHKMLFKMYVIFC